MMKRHVKKASLEELLAPYKDAAHTHGAATESGNYKAGNKAADLIAAIYAGHPTIVFRDDCILWFWFLRSSSMLFDSRSRLFLFQSVFVGFNSIHIYILYNTLNILWISKTDKIFFAEFCDAPPGSDPSPV